MSTPEPIAEEPLTEAQLAALTDRAVARAQRRYECETDPVLQALLRATPAQIETYMTTNVTNLAQARRVLLALALAVRHLYLKQ